MYINSSVIMVLYNPEIYLLDNNLKILSGNDNIKKIILVDNSKNRLSNKIIETVSSKVEYIFLNDNRGIGYAQNVGIKKCLSQEVEKIFFFDQDTQISSSYIDDMLHRFSTIEKKDSKIGILSPTYIEYNDNEVVIPSQINTLVAETISSGSLMKIEIFHNVGLMESELFIDYVDFEFCWRCKKFGYLVYTTNDIIMKHKVGEKIIKIFGKKIYVPQPFRYFYIYKNGKKLLLRDYVPKKWKKRERIIRVITPIVVILLLDKKRERLKYILKGVTDGY